MDDRTEEQNIKWHVKVTQSRPTLCDPMDYTADGILSARILEWEAIPFSSRASQPSDQALVSHTIQLKLKSQHTIVVLLVTQLCTMCDTVDCSPTGCSVHGILQSSILEWVVIPFFRGSSQPRDWTQVSCTAGKFFILRATREGHSRYLIQISLFSLFNTNMHAKSLQLCATLWTVAWQASLPRGFSRQEYRSGLPCPPERDFLNPGIETASLTSPAGSLPLAPPRKPLTIQEYNPKKHW